MKDEISQEAKTAAAVREQRATERLRQAGAYSTPAVQRRIQAFAIERGIPPAEYAKLLHKRISTAAFMAFCKKHNVSADWLLCGDLKGLQRMTNEAKATPETTRRAQEQEFRRLMLQLKPDQLPALIEILRRQFDNGGDAA